MLNFNVIKIEDEKDFNLQSLGENADALEDGSIVVKTEEGIKDIVVFPNQVKAANQMFESLKKGDVDLIKLTAEMQSGKTGAILYSIHLYTEWQEEERRNGKYIPNTKFLFIGPSDRQLKDQTYERVQPWGTINPALLGSNIWHMPDLLDASKRGRELKVEMKQHLARGGQIIVIWDEAHIGISKKKTTDSEGNPEEQVLPTFLRSFASLPGMTSNPNVKHIMTTATPFTLDYFEAVCRDYDVDLNIVSIFLEPGEGYTGIIDLLKQGRIKQAFGPFNRKEKKEFLEKMAPFLKKQKLLRGPKYAVVRSTVTYQQAWWEEACALAGVQCSAYNSRLGTIPDFQRKLNEQPEEFEVLLIQRSYKQGKTLCKKYLGLWYENLTKSGRNDADVWQSVGRCLGYYELEYKTDFDIYMNVSQARKAKNYYKSCSMLDIDASIRMATSDTATKRKTKSKVRRVLRWKNTEKDMRNYMISKGVSKSDITLSKCSLNNSFDVAEEIVKKLSRQQKVGGRQNIRHLDAPNPYYSNSVYFDKLVKEGRVGQYCWIEDQEVVEEQKVVSKGVFDGFRKKKEQEAQRQGNLF